MQYLEQSRDVLLLSLRIVTFITLYFGSMSILVRVLSMMKSWQTFSKQLLKVYKQCNF